MEHNETAYTDAYKFLRSELAKTEEGSKVLETLFEAMAIYVGTIAANIAARDMSFADKEYREMHDAYDEARSFLSANAEADISVLVDDRQFLEGLAGHSIRKVMEMRSP